MVKSIVQPDASPLDAQAPNPILHLYTQRLDSQLAAALTASGQAEHEGPHRVASSLTHVPLQLCMPGEHICGPSDVASYDTPPSAPPPSLVGRAGDAVSGAPSDLAPPAGASARFASPTRSSYLLGFAQAENNAAEITSATTH